MVFCNKKTDFVTIQILMNNTLNKILLIKTILDYSFPWKSYMISSKVSKLSRGWPEGSLFNSYNTKVQWRVLLHFLHCSTLPLIQTLCWVWSKTASSTIFWVVDMAWPGIEPWSPGPLVNTLCIRPTISSIFLIQIICTLYGLKYFYLILIIYRLLYGITGPLA